jgi:uncharacterized protein DUF551
MSEIPAGATHVYTTKSGMRTWAKNIRFDGMRCRAKVWSLVDKCWGAPENIRLSRLEENGERMSEWHPIETAPHGVDVLLFCPDRGCESNRARIELGCASQGWRNEVANNVSYHPWATHWMSLPEPPNDLQPIGED